MSLKIKRLTEWVCELEKTGDMLVPGRIYADKETMEELLKDYDEKKPGGFTPALGQVLNVACLPGIVNASLAMADIHPGYGVP
ncbi:MAG: RNA-splicing ligase RtcB, partial [Deltaproteobacteria bacterium]